MNKHNALLSKLPFWGSCGGFLFSLLLLLLLVSACSDEGREMAEIQQGIQESDEVELSIRTQIPEMEVGSRAVTESITSITAFAFDGATNESVLIKKIDATISNKTDTTGTLKIKVPKRTRSIHFVAKNGASYDAGEYTLGETNLQDLLLNKTTTDLHYWGMLTFADAEALKANNISLTLYRNMAKVVLTSNVDAGNDYIAGFINYNGNGSLVPHDGNGTLGYQSDAVTLPDTLGMTSHDSPQNLGTEYFLSEHANEEGYRIYAICYIGGKYYKIAFSNSSGVFFPLVRNHLYRIVINQISGGSDSYDAAKNADPINGSVREETMNVKNVSLISYKGNTSQVTVTIPDGVTSLKVTSLPEQFEISSTEVIPANGVYDVTGKQSVNFTLTLKDDYIGTTGTPTISFSGSGTSINATGTGTVTLNGFMDMYEMYFDGGNLGGSTEYDKFFYDRNSVDVQITALTTEYVDAGANSSTLAHNHTSAAINMQSNSTIKFTIAEERYLTLLVASSGNNTPSIDLQKDSTAWTETSDKATVPPKYNFSKDGDITTSGRLIRYTLEPGTYTLQRGNNDYLLYYMRISKEKPTMTDIVQPDASDYSLSWSGGEWGNWTYVENVGYVVDDDAKTFTLTYKGLGLTEGTLTLNNSTLTIPRGNDQSDTYTASGNSFTITNANVGTYTYTIGSGEITTPDYKYSNFYDKIALKAVANSNNVTVKNSVKLKLTNDSTSYNSQENNVDAYTAEMTDPRLAICSPATRINTGRSFVFTIKEDWTYKGNSKTLNDGTTPIVSQNGHTFTIAQGQETGQGQDGNSETWEHPFWYTYIYYLDWGSFTDTSNANRALSTMTISTEDADVWFSYKGMEIAKSLTINVNENPGNVEEPDNTPYEITLDFYTNDSEQGGTGQYTNNNLTFGVTDLYLKAAVPDNVPVGTNIVLKVDVDGRNGIHEYYSYNSDDVVYNWDYHQMTITKKTGITDYIVRWRFVRSDNTQTGNVNVIYSLTSSDETSYILSGETSANITITGNHPQQIMVAVNGGESSGRVDTSLEYTKNVTNQLSVKVTVPDDINELTIEPGDFDVSWTDANGNTISGTSFTFATGITTQDFILTLKEASKVAKDNSIVTFRYAPDRFVAAGVVAVDLSEKVVDDGVVFEHNFNNSDMSRFEFSGGTYTISDGSLIFTATSVGAEDYSNQIVINGISFEQNAVYSLTFKVKSNVTDSNENGLSIGFDNPNDSYNWCGTFANEGTNVKLVQSNNFTEVSLTATATATVTNGRLFFNLGHLGACTIYIDDLKLVKNN